MHLAVALICLGVMAVLLAEFFVVFLLPRRVKRDPRIARGLLRSVWVPWRALAAALPRIASDTMLGVFGPLGLLTILAVLSIGVIACFSGLQWANSSHLGAGHPAAFGQDFYFSAGAFFSASTPSVPGGGLGQAMEVAEAATGFGFLAIAIGYLPALFQAFSRRETAVSRLDPRAGSPPSAGALLERSGRRGGWSELDDYLREWESWTAELMETHRCARTGAPRRCARATGCCRKASTPAPPRARGSSQRTGPQHRATAPRPRSTRAGRRRPPP